MKSLFKRVASVAMVVLGVIAFNAASAATLTSANSACEGYVFPPGQGDVEAAFRAACGTGNDLETLYKVDHSSTGNHSESGPFAGSYSTTFSGDPNNAWIVWDPLTAFISGFERLYVLVKDGRHNPNYFGWDITGWDGQTTISILGLWVGVNGAISTVTIFGVPGSVSGSVSVLEPGPVGLLGLGLIALCLVRRRKPH
jgi:hypothetical protein